MAKAVGARAKHPGSSVGTPEAVLQAGSSSGRGVYACGRPLSPRIPQRFPLWEVASFFLGLCWQRAGGGLPPWVLSRHDLGPAESPGRAAAGHTGSGPTWVGLRGEEVPVCPSPPGTKPWVWRYRDQKIEASGPRACGLTSCCHVRAWDASQQRRLLERGLRRRAWLPTPQANVHAARRSRFRNKGHQGRGTRPQPRRPRQSSSHALSSKSGGRRGELVRGMERDGARSAHPKVPILHQPVSPPGLAPSLHETGRPSAGEGQLQLHPGTLALCAHLVSACKALLKLRFFNQAQEMCLESFQGIWGSCSHQTWCGRRTRAAWT